MCVRGVDMWVESMKPNYTVFSCELKSVQASYMVLSCGLTVVCVNMVLNYGFKCYMVLDYGLKVCKRVI